MAIQAQARFSAGSLIQALHATGITMHRSVSVKNFVKHSAHSSVHLQSQRPVVFARCAILGVLNGSCGKSQMKRMVRLYHMYRLSECSQVHGLHAWPTCTAAGDLSWTFVYSSETVSDASAMPQDAFRYVQRTHEVAHIIQICLSPGLFVPNVLPLQR
jgi:hypothetical protein